GTSLTQVTSTLTVNNINGAVAFPVINEFTIFEGQPLQVRVAAFDPEFPVAPTNPLATSDDFFVDFEGLLPNLTYSHGTLPAGATFDTQRQIFAWSPGFDATGVTETQRYEITFTATDDGDGTGTPTSDTVTLAINVRNANFRPEITTIENKVVPVGTTLDIPIVAVDPDGTAIALDVKIGQATALPSWATLTDNGDGTGTLSVSPQPGDRDDYLVTVTAKESSGEAPLSETVQFILQATSPNEPPKLDPIFDSVALVGQPFTLVFNTTDADQDPLTFTSSTLPAGATFVEDSFYGRATFQWTPTAGDIGTTSITFDVTDSGNNGAGAILSDTRSITLTVRDTNTRPNLEPIGAQTVAEGQTLRVSAVATDAEDDNVFFTAALVQGVSTTRLPVGVLFDGASGELTWTPSSTQAGTYRIRITASDGAGSRSDDVVITVTNTNQPPVLNTLPKLFAREGDQTVFSINGGDADGEPLIYGYAGAAINGFNFDPVTRTVIWDVDFDSAGTYTLPFVVNDPSGGTDTIDVEVQVLPTNRAPSIDAPQLRNAQIGEAFTLSIPTADLDGDSVTLTASDLPEGATLNVTDGVGVIEWTPQSFQAGTYTVRLTADDGATQTRRALTLVASLEPVSPNLQVVLTPSFPATPGQTVTIEPIADSDVAVGEATLTIDGNPIALDALGRGSFVATSPGRYEVTATVTDIEGRTTTVTRPIFIRDLADRTAPRIEITEFAPPIVTGTRDMMFDIFDDGLAEYKVELVPRGGGEPILLREGTTSIVRLVTIDPSNYENGFYTARVTASDFGGLTSVATFDLEINSSDKSGAVTESATDMTVTLAGIDVDVTRFYSSIATLGEGSDFGSAWSWPLIDPQIAIGGKTTTDTFSGLAQGTRLYLTLPTGERVGYTFAPTELTDVASGVQTFQPAWTADDGVTWSLESTATAPLRKSGNAYFVVGTGLPYSPTITGGPAFTLASPSGERHEFSTKGSGLFSLTRIVATGGTTSLRVTDSGIIAPDGSRLTIVRDSEGRISEIVGPDQQQFVYRYDRDSKVATAINATTADRSFYRYEVDGVLAPQSPHIGGTRTLLAAPITASIASGATDRYAFTITDGELRTSPTGAVSISVEVTSSAFDPAVAMIDGVESGFELTESGRSVAVFTLSQSGNYSIAFAGSDAGSYTATIRLVGDIDSDGDVDGADSAAFGVLTTSDFDRDGDVDAVDRAALEAMFGFIANQSPVIDTSADPIVVRGNHPATFSLHQYASDPEGDLLHFSATATGAVVQAMGGGLYRLIPESDVISVSATADDGLIASASVTLPIEFQSVEYVRLQLSRRDPVLTSGGSTSIHVLGILEDGTSEVIPLNEVTFQIGDSSIAAITDRGMLIGGDLGTTTLLVTTAGLTAATAVEVGSKEERIVTVFPDSYTLATGQNRQYQVREVTSGGVIDLFADADTTYVVADPTVAGINEDGFLTAVAEGVTEVTVITRGRSFVTTIRVAPVQTGGAMIDSDGGLIKNDGIEVGIPAGAFDEAIAIDVEEVAITEFPYAPPTGWNAAFGLRIDTEGVDGDLPLSVAIPAPVGMNPGDPLYLFEPAEFVFADGSVDQSWFLVDSMIVGSDGMARTTSLPNIGAKNRVWAGGGISRIPTIGGALMAAAPGSILGILAGLSDLDLREKKYLNFAIKPEGHQSVVQMDATGDLGGSDAFYVYPGLDFDYAIPAIPDFAYTMSFLAAEEGGLSLISSNTVRVDEGTTSNFIVPLKPRSVVTASTPPTILSAEVTFDLDEPKLKLTGTDFTFVNPYAQASDLGSKVEDLYVLIEVGGKDFVGTDGELVVLGGADIRIDGSLLSIEDSSGGEGRKVLTAPIPAGAIIGNTTITVNRPMQLPADGQFRRQVITSNPVTPLGAGNLGFTVSASNDTVSVLDLSAVVDSASGLGQQRRPKLIAEIPLGVGDNARVSESEAPRKTVTSVDGSLLYVTLQRSAAIAVVDAVALQEVDMNNERIGIQAIELPEGATPFDAVTDPDGDYLFVSDYLRPTIYVIDIDRFSPSFHTVLGMLNVGGTTRTGETVGLLGLRGIAVSSDGARLHVAAPAQDLFRTITGDEGAVLNISLAGLRDQARFGTKVTGPDGKPILDATPPLPISFDLNGENAVTFVGPGPFEITATEDPNVMLVTDRVNDRRAFGVIRRVVTESGREEYLDDYVSVVDFGRIPRQAEGRDTHAFAISNVGGVAYVPANAFQEFLKTDSDDGSHPAYAVITGYNALKQGDPKKDPGIAPFFAYNVLEDRPDGDGYYTISVPVGAGGTIGIIRSPLGDFDNILDKPRIVAATRPIQSGFPDDIAASIRTGTIIAPFQATDGVFAYDLLGIIAEIEKEVDGDELPQWSQFPEDPAVNTQLSRLLRGPLSTVPIDAINPNLAIAGDYRYFDQIRDGKLEVGYGVPPLDPFGNEPNNYVPIAVDDSPRGVSVQPTVSPVFPALTPTPFGQRVALQAFPGVGMTVEAGRFAQADAHTGALLDGHELVSYLSQNESRSLRLRYDSLRAEPRTLEYFQVANLPDLNVGDEDFLAVGVTAIGGDIRIGPNGVDPTDPVLAAAGLDGGEALFKVGEIKKGSGYGAGVPIDFTDAPTGLYNLRVEAGVLKSSGGGYSLGTVIDQTEPLAVVNGIDSPFGAGWGLEGLLRLHAGTDGVLLVDGNGTEQIFLSPEVPGQPYTPLVPDYSRLEQDENGAFTWRLLDGTVHEFNDKGLLVARRDRNLNETKFEYSGDVISKMIDPVKLETVFESSGGKVTAITDPAGRTTRFKYNGDRLIKITDPDGTFRTFEYDARIAYEDSAEPLFENLITAQTLKRGGPAPSDVTETESDFRETYDYDAFGRITGGQRVDDKSFTLTAAQTLGAILPNNFRELDTAVPLVELTDSEREAPDTSILTTWCGVSEPEMNEEPLTRFLAEANYVDFEGRDHKYLMDGFGSLVKEKNENETRYQSLRAADNGAIVAEISPGGVVTCHVRDIFDNVVKTTRFPDGLDGAKQVDIYRYDTALNNQLDFRQDAVGRTFTYTLDAFGNKTHEVINDPSAPAGSPSSVTRLFSYGTGGLLTSTTDGESNVVLHGFDEHGRIQTVTYTNGVEQYTYVGLSGDLATMTDPAGDMMTYTYDALGRLETTTYTETLDDTTYTETRSYDAHSNLRRVVDYNGNITEFTYDKLDRAVSRVDAVGTLDLETLYAYSPAGLEGLYATQTGQNYEYAFRRDPRGNWTGQVFDAKSLLIAEYDELGRETTHKYDDNDFIDSTTLPDGSVIDYTSDKIGRMVGKSGPGAGQNASTYVYDLANRLIRETHVNPTTGDQITEYTYNLFDKVAKTVDAEKHVHLQEYDSAGNRTAVIVASGTDDQFRTDYTFDGRNRIETSVAGGTATTTYEYYPDSQLHTVTDARGGITTYVYGTMDSLLSVTDAISQTTHYVYDGVGNLTAIVDPRGASREDESFRTTFVYDEANRQTTVTNAVGSVTRFGYDKAGNRTSIISPRSATVGDEAATTTMDYDRIGNLIETIEPEGRRVVLGYDPNFNYRTLEEIYNGDELERRTQWDYHADGRVKTMTDSLGRETRYDYDKVGNLIRVVDPRGAAVRTEYTHDRLNRVLTTTMAAARPEAATYTTTYNAAGLIDTETDPLGLVTAYDYDSLQQAQSVTMTGADGLEFVQKFVYDKLGYLTSFTDARGDFYTTEYDVDLVGQTLSQTGPSGTIDDPKPYEIVYTYDAVGNVETISDPRDAELLTSYQYDAVGRRISEEDAMGNLAHYAYDEIGNLVAYTDPRGARGEDEFTTVYEFDLLNRPTGVRQPGGGMVCQVFDAVGNVVVEVGAGAGRTTCEGLTAESSSSHRTVNVYNEVGYLLSSTDAEGNETLYTNYDGVGNVGSITDGRGFETKYSYDGLDHIARIVRDAGSDGNETATETFQYDKVGNLRMHQDARGAEYETRYEYDGHYRMIQSSIDLVVSGGDEDAGSLVEKIAYDNVGNIVAITDPRGDYFTTTFKIDAGNRVVSSTQPTGSAEAPGTPAVFTYQFDVAGNLIAEGDSRGDAFTVHREFDDAGRIERIVRPTGTLLERGPDAVTDIEYDAAGNVEKIVYPRANADGERYAHTFDLDGRGALNFEVDAAGYRTEYKYDDAGNVRERTEVGDGFTATRITTLEYDQLNRLRFERLEGHTTETKYDENGNITLIAGPFVDSAGSVMTTQMAYDALGFMKSTTDGSGNTQFIRRDNVGNAIETIDPRGDYYKSTFRFDGANRLLERTDPTGSFELPGESVTTKYRYDGAGNVVEEIDPRGDDYATFRTYDAQGFVTKIDRLGGTPDDARRNVETFQYDIVGNVTKYVDARGEGFATVMTYDLQDNLASRTYAGDDRPGSRVERFVYDPAGNLIEQFGLADVGTSTVMTYDGLGRVVKVVNPLLETTDYTYDRFGNEVRIVDYQGESRSDYDAFDRLTYSLDAEGNEEVFTYANDSIISSTLNGEAAGTSEFDVLGRLSKRIDGDGGETSYQYDAVGNTTTITDRRGTRTEIVYDARNLPLRVTEAVGADVEATSSLEYDVLGRLKSETDARGEFFTTTYVYDNLSRLIERHEPVGTPTRAGTPTPGFDKSVHQYRYTPTGNVAYEIPAGGDDYRIDYTYDAMDHAASMSYKVNVDGSLVDVTESLVYDTAGRLVQSIDSAGFVTKQSFDPLNRITGYSTDAAGDDAFIDSTWTYSANTLGQKVERIGPEGQLIESVQYDRRGRVLSQQTLGSQPESYEYDARGLVLSETIGDRTTTYGYNARGHLQTETDPAGNVTTYEFDAEGNLLSRQRPGLSNPEVFEYDERGRLETETRGDGSTTTYGYDAASFIHTITDASGSVTTYDRDITGLAWSDVNEHGTRLYDYDAMGNQTRMKDRNDRVITREFNTRDQVTREDWLDDTDTILDTLTYNYTVDGRLSQATHGAIDVTRNFTDDGNRQVAGETTNHVPIGGAIELTIGYDSLGRRDSAAWIADTEALFGQQYQYTDALGRLSQITQSGPAVTDKTVDWTYATGLDKPATIGRQTVAADAVSVTSTYSYDARGLVDSLAHAGAGVINSYSHAYDLAGRITGRSDSFDSAVYSYDDGDQLLSVTHTQDVLADEVYGYAEDGRRSSSTTQIGPLQYEGQNRLTSDGIHTFAYDNEGNLIEQIEIATGNRSTFDYDHRNRLIEIEVFVDGEVQSTTTFIYDALDRRVEMITDKSASGGVATSRYFVYDGQDVALEYTQVDGGDTDLVSVNLFGMGTDQAIAVDDTNGEVVWLLGDSQGNIRDVAHDQGTSANHITMDAFGNVVEQTDAANAVRFLMAGREFDVDTGLYYMRARYMDPQTGRFLSDDPLGRIDGDINGFRYAMNSPTMISDPTGLSPAVSPHPWSSVYVGTHSERTGLMLGLEALLYVPDAFATTVNEVIGFVFDPILIGVQATFDQSKTSDFFTLGSFWTGSTDDFDKLTTMGPLVVGLGVAALGGVAGGLVGGPAGAAAGFMIAGDIFGVVSGAKTTREGFNEQDPRKIAQGYVDIGLSAIGLPFGVKGLNKAIAAKRAGHAKPTRVTGDSKVNTPEKTVAEASADKPAGRSSQAGNTAASGGKSTPPPKRPGRGQGADTQPNTTPSSQPMNKTAKPVKRKIDTLNEKLFVEQQRSAFREVADARRSSMSAKFSEARKAAPDAKPPLSAGDSAAKRAASNGPDVDPPPAPGKPGSPSTPPNAPKPSSGSGGPAGGGPSGTGGRPTGGPTPPPAMRAPLPPNPTAAISSVQKALRNASGLSRSQASTITTKVASVLRSSGDNLFFAVDDLAKSIEHMKGLTAGTIREVSGVLSKNLSPSTIDLLEGQIRANFRRTTAETAGATGDALRKQVEQVESISKQASLNRLKNAEVVMRRSWDRAAESFDTFMAGLGRQLPDGVLQDAINFANRGLQNSVGQPFISPSSVTGSIAAHYKRLSEAPRALAKELTELRIKISSEEALLRQAIMDLPESALNIADNLRLQRIVAEDIKVARALEVTQHLARDTTSMFWETVRSGLNGPTLLKSSTVKMLDEIADLLDIQPFFRPLELNAMETTPAIIPHPVHVEVDTSLPSLPELAGVAIESFDSLLLPWQQRSIVNSIRFVWNDLPAGQLGQGLWLPPTDDDDRPVFEITIDTDAAGHGWFVDPTPERDEEFGASGNLIDGDESQYDLLTVIRHELGHAIGFGDVYRPFVTQTETDFDGQVWFITGDDRYRLNASGSELEPTLYPDQLMAANLSPGLRKAPGDVDLQILSDVLVMSHDTSYLDVKLSQQAFLHTDDHAGNHGGFVTLATGVADSLRSDPGIGLAAIDSPLWNSIGSVSVADGTATISEDVGMISDLSQTFVVPVGLRSVSFTLGGVSMDVAGTHPSEAFEAAILRAVETTSVAGEMVGMAGGDAAFNLQADGSVRYASGVVVSGASASGDVIDVNREDIRITLPVPESATGEAVTLYFDLIGFGDEASSITVSDVRMNFNLGWQNPIDRFDVDDMGDVTARDALLIINELHRKRVHDPVTRDLFAITDDVGPPPFYDVNGDGKVSALDALQVLNQVGRLSGNLESELPESWQNPI
ncbi:MAG: putative Ig domain-containing protein, partial [Rubripirellula sp.]